jgi:hypothetical protein
VVALAQMGTVFRRPEASELGANPPVPVDERPIAVKARPTRLSGHGYPVNFLMTRQALCPPKPKLFERA